jgi:hypothetical protein
MSETGLSVACWEAVPLTLLLGWGEGVESTGLPFGVL